MQERPYHILLVDDSRSNLLMLEDMLSQPNRSFFTAESGEAALQKIKDVPRINLVIMDVQMPVMDGFTAAKILKSNKNTRHIPIIFISGVNKGYEDVIKGFEEGGVDYLMKPLDVELTRAKVRVFEEMHGSTEFLKETIADKNKINTQLNRYIYVVAHDLRAPLSAITSMLEILGYNQELLENEDFRELYPVIMQSANNLKDMIGSILTYSRIDAEKNTLERVNVYDLVRVIIRFLFPPKSITFHVEEQLPTIYTEKVKLMQVFQNLIGNAMKFVDKRKGEIAIGFEDVGPFYRFTVKDNGVGMTKSQASGIFNLFATAHHEKSETGIGLNVVKMIVEEQGGHVAVDSEPGAGSCFYFTWPKIAEPGAAI